MSSAGQAVGGLVGGIAGFLIGGPTGAKYGAQIGITIGGYLDPVKKKVEGPRLDDLSVQTSTYGAVIPRLYGMVDVIGNVFWLENNRIKETVTKKKSGGKGGGSKTTTRTYSYSATFAVGLCKGPIVGVRRIWIGPELIYDAGSTDPGTIAASNAAATGFTVYTGTDTQSPNARMQATLGAANTPAWRGLAYIVFYDLQLEKYGNSLAGAQVKVEVVTTPLGSSLVYQLGTRPGSSPYYWRAPTFNGTYFCVVDGISSQFLKSTDGLTWVQNTIPGPYRADPPVLKADPVSGTLLLGSSGYVVPGALRRSTDHGATWTPIMKSTWQNTFGIQKISWGVDGKVMLIAAIFDIRFFLSSDYGQTFTQQLLPAHPDTSTNYGEPSWVHDRWVVSHSWGVTPQVDIYTSFTGVGGSWSLVATLSPGINAPARFIYHQGAIMGISGNGSLPGILKSLDGGASWTLHTYAAVNVPSDFFFSDGEHVWRGQQGSFFYSADGVSWTQTYHTILNNKNHHGIYANGIRFWTDFEYPTNNVILITKRPTFGDQSIALSTIVSAESLSSGLLASGDIDVTSLTATVRGYRVSNIGAIRAALEPLRVSWPFDCVQRGYKIVYVARGAASVGIIAADDLDARADGTAPGIQITTSREMDAQLPRRVTINYLDVDREYDAGTQYAERLNTPAINNVVHDLPIVLNGSEGAGKAEVLLYLAWMERHDVSIKLPPVWNHLEPADVVGLTTPEGVVSLRLTAVNYTSDGRVECEAKYANAAIYTPTAVGASSVVTGQTSITQIGPALYHLLDIPLVHDAQDSASFLAAMCGTLSGWPGGSVYQSTDAGATWASIEDFPPPGSTIGAASNSIGTVESRVIDKASRLTVVLTQGELFDVTELAMLGGANHFAYGADGRWEIIAAQTCALQNGTTYVLSNLLRGRFGSEQHMGSHSTGDALVLLDLTDVSVIPMSSGAIGLARQYRGITSGRDLSTDSNRSFTYNAVNLKPLAPIALTGHRDPSSNDWWMGWIRRTRIGGEWRDYVDAALGEASEQYQVDIFADGSYTTVKRTLTVGTSAAVYTNADQVTDFGSNQSTLFLKIYQMSATVGRGYPLTTSITR